MINRLIGNDPYIHEEELLPYLKEREGIKRTYKTISLNLNELSHVLMEIAGGDGYFRLDSEKTFILRIQENIDFIEDNVLFRIYSRQEGKNLLFYKYSRYDKIKELLLIEDIREIILQYEKDRNLIWLIESIHKIPTPSQRQYIEYMEACIKGTVA